MDVKYWATLVYSALMHGTVIARWRAGGSLPAQYICELLSLVRDHTGDNNRCPLCIQAFAVRQINHLRLGGYFTQIYLRTA